MPVSTAQGGGDQDDSGHELNISLTVLTVAKTVKCATAKRCPRDTLPIEFGSHYDKADACEGDFRSMSVREVVWVCER